MILKRIASKGNKKARNCLKCNSRLLNLKDNVVNTCEVCGQQHLVDFYTSGSSWQQQIRTSLITGGDCMDFVPEESIKNMQKRIDL